MWKKLTFNLTINLGDQEIQCGQLWIEWNHPLGYYTYCENFMTRWSTLHLQSSDLELILLPGIGGRLWDIRFQGNSLLFQNEDLIGIEEIHLDKFPTRSPQFKFPLWGGEKTWIAPDSFWIGNAPFPELDNGPYEVTSQSDAEAVLQSLICPITELCIKRTVTLKSSRSFTIDHCVTNCGNKTRLTGIWSVMMLSTPTKILVETDCPEVHPVFGFAEDLVRSFEKFSIVDCNRQLEFKIGLMNPTGETVIKAGEAGTWIKCSTKKPTSNVRYAHDYPIEIFNSSDYPYCEAEWHSPVMNLKAGNTMHFRQDFEIWDNNHSPLISEEFVRCMS